MLNFTFSGKHITGVFNGRFAFRASFEAIPPSLKSLRALSDGEESALETDVLRHEYLHWLAFRSSFFGIETVGRRFRARASFMKGNHDEVVSYYRQRTAYFCCVYSTHEAVVHEQEDESTGHELSLLKTLRLSSDQLHRIASADSLAKEASRKLNSLSNVFLRAADLAKGYAATREYGVQSYIRDDDGRGRIREVSLSSATSGIINAAFETQIGKQGRLITLLKTLRRRLNTEGRAGGLPKQKMAMWAVLKFATEAQTMEALREYGYPVPLQNFSTYARQIADFSFRYLLLQRDWILRRNLVSLILDCQSAADTPEQIPSLTDRFAGFDEGILYFFYIHGN